jgi:hypothetical protein
MFKKDMSDKQKLNFIETAYWSLWIILCLSVYIGSSYVADMDSFLSVVDYDDKFNDLYTKSEHPIHFVQYRYFASLIATWCIGTLLIIYSHYKICRTIDTSY